MRSVRPTLRIIFAVLIRCIGLLLAALVLHFLIVMGVFDGPLRNPYKRDNICFVRDLPGATSRYVEYTFVTCTEPRKALAEPVGADQAVLSFEDVDGDGKPEAVVESSRYKCKFGGLGCYGASRTVLKICGECAKQVVVVSQQAIPELEWAVPP